MVAHSIGARRSLTLGRLLCLGALLLAWGAAAEPAPQRDPHAGARYEQDKATVEAAARAMATGRAPALAAYVAALEDVREHTPAGYRKIEEADGETRYRAEDLAEFVEFTAWREGQAKTRGAPERKIVWLPYTYANASYLLGWFFNESRQYEKSLATLDRGLSLTPDEAHLIAEKGQALISLGRIDAALDLYERTLSADVFRPTKVRALLLRAEGFCLTEKKRFDDAEHAYRESLRLEPDHAGARQELEYIARVRGGGAPTAPVMTTYDKAKKNGVRDEKP